MPEQRYERIAVDIERRIRQGEFPPGTPLPSRREFREQYAVSGSVIDKAMFILRSRELTDTLPGVAVYVRNPLPPPR